MKRLLSWLLLGYLLYPLLEILLWRGIWARRAAKSAPPSTGWSNGLLYLSGISDFTTAELLPNQYKLMQQAVDVCWPDVSLHLTFPYETVSPQEYKPLDLWHRLGYARTPIYIYPWRNVWQTLLCTWFPDWYGSGVARVLHNALGHANPNASLVVLGNSTGAAMLLAATPFLRQMWPDVRITAIMCGGVFGAKDSFAEIDHFYQLLGERDSWAKFGKSLVPGRYANYTDYNQFQHAKSDGRYEERIIGNQTHFGKEGYFSEQGFPATAQAILNILQSI